jgi:hypothetical protein
MQPVCAAITRFADRTVRQAWLILALTAVGIFWLLSAALTTSPAAVSNRQGGNDLRLYRSIVTRVHSGENYYEAAGRELRAQGYPTGSPFNWRTPLYAWFLGNLPSLAWGQILLGLGALATMLMAYGVVKREGGTARAIATVLLLLGAFYWCVDGDAFLVQELWSGMLIAVSICAYAQDRRRLGVAAGLAALFLRELALPYCLIALGFAWQERHRKEALAWLAGLAAYTIYLLCHGMEVTHHITATDRLPATWIQFGGASFILTTCRMNAFLFALPRWVGAIYLPLSLLGLAAWRGPSAVRIGLTVGAYLSAFAVVGQPFNDYWGLMMAPLLAFGLAWAPTAVSDLAARILTSHKALPCCALLPDSLPRPVDSCKQPC